MTSFSFKWVPKYILFFAKLKGEGRPFTKGTRIDLPSKLSLTYGRNVNHHKSVHLSGRFQNKSLTFLSNECPSIFSYWPNWRAEEGFFLEGAGMEPTSWSLNSIKVRSFSRTISKKKHLYHHDKIYCYFCKSNIPVINLIVDPRNVIKVSKNMSL